MATFKRKKETRTIVIAEPENMPLLASDIKGVENPVALTTTP